MATHKGNSGSIKIGANAVAEITSWSLSQQTEMLEDTAMGDTDKSFKTGLKSWNGSINCWWDPSDSNGQELLNNGENATLILGPGGLAQADVTYSGDAIISDLERSGEKEGSIVTATFNFQGNGALTQGTVA